MPSDDIDTLKPASESPQVECAYCGTPNPETVDHVPPKGLFPPPRPSNLITVPCCRGCNKGFGKDDEYFRAVLSSRFDIDHNPSVQQVREIVLRGFEREESAGFRKSFLTSFEEVDVHTKGGIFLGAAAQFHVEEPRLSSTATRIVRGIHFHDHKRRLAPDCRIVAYVDVGFIDENGTVEPIAVNIVNRITVAQAKVIEPNVFLYWRQVIPDTDGLVEHLVASILFSNLVSRVR